MNRDGERVGKKLLRVRVRPYTVCYRSVIEMEDEDEEEEDDGAAFAEDNQILQKIYRFQ